MFENTQETEAFEARKYVTAKPYDARGVFVYELDELPELEDASHVWESPTGPISVEIWGFGDWSFDLDDDTLDQVRASILAWIAYYVERERRELGNEQ